MENLLRFTRHAKLSYTALFGFLNPRTYILVMLLNPLTQILFFGMLVNYVYEGEGLAGYIAANALLLCVMSAVFGMMSVVTSDRGMGTLPIVMASPASKSVLFFARSVPHILNGVFTACLGLGFGLLLFNISIPVSAVLPLIVVWFVSIFSACCLGLILASCSFWTPSMHLLSNLLGSVLLLLSGANYSLSVMPSWLSELAKYFPLTRGVELTKALVTEGHAPQFFQLMTQELLLGCLYFIISLVAIRYAEYLARVKGTMELS
ncbi:ABC transporter permease [Solibacillus sp. MA9]|uniref:Transport permease protein n=1 Tax=Solibacillus palustris TaxID=2908203 RepID=A0ABS9UAG9_9BACL|nr:ABC transporter permease [Solibacillus sp. MA9]MCH7321332.1 ABC transporter permease [Solibacillus sp. MA9]